MRATPETTLTIIGLLRELDRRVLAQLRGVLAREDLTMPQFFVLKAVAAEDGLGLVELSRKLQLTPSTTSGIVERLRRGGWLERLTRDRDRRAVTIRLTEKARSFLAQDHHVESFQRLMAAELDEAEARRIVAALEALHSCLQRMEDPQ